MQLIKTKDDYKRLIHVDGLIEVTFEHEVKSTKAKIEWKGPKLGREMWNQVLAFLKWTQDTTKSEAQMRLFVNNKTQQWAAWAFPQTCGTGMTTKEVPDTNDDWTKQRAQFPDSEGWSLFGTVHHHCNCAAFQSGTDEQNEKDQDGLHITIGKLDDAQYDIHARFYIAGNCFNPDMSLLWDVTELMGQVPKWAMAHMNKDLPNLVARWEMTQPAPADTKFPDEWKANMIEEKPVAPSALLFNGHVSHGAYDPRNNMPSYHMTKKQRRAWKRANKFNTKLNLEYDLKKAAEEIAELIAENQGSDIQDVLTTLDNIEQCGPMAAEVFEICKDNDVTTSGLYGYIETLMEKYNAEQEQNKLEEEGGKTADPGKGTVPLDPATEAEAWARAYGVD